MARTPVAARTIHAKDKEKHTSMKGRRYILLCALCAITLWLPARQYEQGEKIYVNADQSNRDGAGKFNWSVDNANLLLYVWKHGVTNSQQWVDLVRENGNLFSGDMPAGNFDRCILLRKNSIDNAHDFNNEWDRAGDITITESVDRNVLNEFWKNSNGSSWATYTPQTSKIDPFVSAERSAGREEHIAICPSALNGPFSLRVKLKADKSDYDYDNVQCHGWYMSTDGSNWTSVDAQAGIVRDGEGEKAIINNVLPASGNTIYYYLHSAKTAGKRLIKLTTDATGCELDCTITAFEVACSEVNANDTTYTLDGMVAFGEPSGNLVITCDGKTTTISNAKSPQIFSIAGLRAATTSGKMTTATASFSGNSACTKTTTVHIPNATQGITYTHIDVLTGETAALNPTGANYTNEHKWSVDGAEQATMQGAQTSTAHNQPNTTIYTYREFNPPAGDMSDMMRNGGYDTTDVSVYGDKWQTSTISDYEFWGKYETTTQLNFYTDTTGTGCVNPYKRNSNGFAVVKSANNFFYTFAKVQAREKNYFALFDAASDGQSGKKAWKAETKNNPNLKLQKGTTYLFSFWAANINNYGEMDNAAKLQFQIEYNGKKEKLGEVLDLNSAEFRNNRWHQCSATFTADENATDVTISVVNLNTNTLNTGNDFALDDIQFRAVSSATRSVRMQQVFEVQTHEPHIYSLAADVSTMPCGVTQYDVNITVTYDNPKGKLVIEDLTDNTILLSQAMGTPDWDKKKTLVHTIHLDTLSEAVHNYKAYFTDWTKAEASGSSTAPVYTDCPPEPTCNDSVMFRKWENVIFIDNHDKRYATYQWYKNGKPMSGETAQRYYAGKDVSLKGTTDRYHCVMTCTDGTTDETCAHPFDSIPSSADKINALDLLTDGVSIYPTTVAAGKEVTIRLAYPGIVQATLLTLTGQTINTIQIHGESRFTMPAEAGMYLIRLQSPETQRTIKIHVY